MKRKIALITLILLTLLIGLTSIDTYAEDLPCYCLLDHILDPYDMGLDHLWIISDDNSPAVWVGGDFIVGPNLSETEGLTVVMGNMIVQSDQLLNVGVVGAGSGIFPEFGSVMLAVGGDLTVVDPSKARVGAAVTSFDPYKIASAAVLIGGIADGDVLTLCYEHEEYDVCHVYDQEERAVSYWSGFEDELKRESGELAGAGMVETGYVDIDSSNNNIVFTSTNPVAPLQVFNIDAVDLAKIPSTGGFVFNNMPKLDDDRFTPIVINVTGKEVTMHQSLVSFVEDYDGIPRDVWFTTVIDNHRVDDLDKKIFRNAASAILWNFYEAEELKILGTSQVMGSIIAPVSDVEVYIEAHTNGRLYVNGNLTRAGDGTEHHNFPWTGGLWFGCNHDSLDVVTLLEEPDEGGGEGGSEGEGEGEGEGESGSEGEGESGSEGEGEGEGEGESGSEGEGEGESESEGGSEGGGDAPDSPDNPDAPDSSGGPDNPDSLDDPNEVDIPVSPSPATSLPQTGSNILVWIIALRCIALLCFISSYFLLRRKAP